MVLSPRQISALYRDCNRLYFGGRLPDRVRCSVMHNARCAGLFTYRTDPQGRARPESFRLQLTDRVRWTDESLRSVLLHEMVHMSCVLEGRHLLLQSLHLGPWRRERKRLLRDYGIRICSTARDCDWLA